MLSDFGVGAKTALSLPTYAFGYLFNYSCLVIFVDILLLPADYVALALIVVTAGILFALQPCWVFPRKKFPPAGNREVSAP